MFILISFQLAQDAHSIIRRLAAQRGERTECRGRVPPVNPCAHRACKLEHNHLQCDRFWSATVRREGIVKAHQHGRQIEIGHVTHYHSGQGYKAMSLDKGKPPNGTIGGAVAHQT